MFGLRGRGARQSQKRNPAGAGLLVIRPFGLAYGLGSGLCDGRPIPSITHIR
jgi:hypothetical protein